MRNLQTGVGRSRPSDVGLAGVRAAAFTVTEMLETRLLFATINVTTANDTLTPGDGLVSLREAITATNANSNLGDPDIIAQNPGGFGPADTIKFNIPGAGIHTINVGSTGKGALPVITDGVTINGYSQPGASANTQANADNAVIAIELNGASAGGSADGLDVHIAGGGNAGKHAEIRGLAINRFSLNGIHIGSNSNVIAGNFTGTNPQGTVAEPNQNDGIRIAFASNNTVGGTSPADRNVSSGNTIDGIHIVGDLSHPSTQNKIQGNFSGLNAAGTGSVGNRPGAPAPGSPQGNSFFGIEVSGGNNNLIGGTTAGARNVVGLNGAGIEVDNGGQGNTIQGNYSGVGADGVTPAGNLLHGVVLRSDGNLGAPLGPGQPNEPGVKNNLVGGTVAGAGNLIEFNGTGGVAVFGHPVAGSLQTNNGNAILGNTIYLNGRSNPTVLLGIDLVTGPTFPTDDGVTPNDSDPDIGPNNVQNFPVLTSAKRSGSSTVIAGSLTSTPNTTFRVEFFANDPDPLGGIAEGQKFLGFTNVTTGSNGKANFSKTVAAALASNQLITATATDPGGNTSEFSAAVQVVQPTTLAINDVKKKEGNSGNTDFVFTVTRSGDLSGTSSVHFATANGPLGLAGFDYDAISGTLNFAKNEQTKTITVHVHGDTKKEADETFFVNLSAAVDASISDSQGLATIQNDD